MEAVKAIATSAVVIALLLIFPAKAGYAIDLRDYFVEEIPYGLYYPAGGIAGWGGDHWGISGTSSSLIFHLGRVEIPGYIILRFHGYGYPYPSVASVYVSTDAKTWTLKGRWEFRGEAYSTPKISLGGFEEDTYLKVVLEAPYGWLRLYYSADVSGILPPDKLRPWIARVYAPTVGGVRAGEKAWALFSAYKLDDITGSFSVSLTDKDTGEKILTQEFTCDVKESMFCFGKERIIADKKYHEPIFKKLEFTMPNKNYKLRLDLIWEGEVRDSREFEIPVRDPKMVPTAIGWTDPVFEGKLARMESVSGVAAGTIKMNKDPILDKLLGLGIRPMNPDMVEDRGWWEALRWGILYALEMEAPPGSPGALQIIPASGIASSPLTFILLGIAAAEGYLISWAIRSRRKG